MDTFNADRSGFVIAALSFGGGEGRTTTSFLTAAALAAAGKHVLVIDLDSHWNLTWLCGLEPNEDRDVLTNAQQLVEHVRTIRTFSDGGSLSLLPGPGRVRALASSAQNWLPSLLDSARQNFDVVFVDVAPFGSGEIGPVVAAQADVVFACLRCHSSDFIQQTTYTFTESYSAYKAMVRARLELIDWLEDRFDDEYGELISDESSSDEAIHAAMVETISRHAAEGAARFGDDWTVGCQRWLEVDLEENNDGGPGDVLHPRDPDYAEFAVAQGFVTARAHTDSDVVAELHPFSAQAIADNLAARNRARGFPADKTTAQQHLGVVVTQCDEALLPVVPAQVDGLLALVPKAAAPVADGEPRGVAGLIGSDNPAWKASVTLARGLIERLSPQEAVTD